MAARLMRNTLGANGRTLPIPCLVVGGRLALVSLALDQRLVVATLARVRFGAHAQVTIELRLVEATLADNALCAHAQSIVQKRDYSDTARYEIGPMFLPKSRSTSWLYR